VEGSQREHIAEYRAIDASHCSVFYEKVDDNYKQGLCDKHRRYR